MFFIHFCFLLLLLTTMVCTIHFNNQCVDPKRFFKNNMMQISNKRIQTVIFSLKISDFIPKSACGLRNIKFWKPELSLEKWLKILEIVIIKINL